MTARPLKVAAVVLAAGRSSRMAPRNKLLELLDRKPVITHVVNAALGSGADPVIVVTGFEAERIGEALRGLKVKVVHNADYAQGLNTSLRAGLKALMPNTDGAIILLGDMPQIQSGNLNALIAALKDQESICVPVRSGRRGNPLLWGARYFPEMMGISGDVGAKPLMANYLEHVVEVPINSDGIFADIDTTSQLARLRSKPSRS
jgi:molybdenum cofactor cytidylyltransferase